MSSPTEAPLTPRVSVVMCTVNRPDLIGSAVASVLACDHDSFELIIVDQSSTSATREVIEALPHDPRVRYVHTTRVGLSSAYNIGISEARADLLAFTDDDCVAPANWLTAIERAFHEVPDADLLYGSVLAAKMYKNPGEYVPALIMPERTRISKKDRPFVVYGMGANFAARRRLFSIAGGFDEILGGGGPLRSSQDHDLSYRAYRAGLVTLLEPSVVVEHYGVRTTEQWPALVRAYAIGDAAFRLKHARCGDGFALLRLFGGQFLDLMVRAPVRIVQRKPNATGYLRGYLEGMWMSLSFRVDRQQRVYLPKRA